MKSRALWMILLNGIAVLCLGWLAMALWDGNEALAAMVFDGADSFYMTVPLIPLLALFIFGVTSFILVKKYSGGKMSFKLFMLPPEFSEQDERESFITAKACRNAYISLTYSVPAVVAFMTLQPVIGRTFPYFSLWLVMLIPIIQWLSYYTTVRRLQK